MAKTYTYRQIVTFLNAANPWLVAHQEQTRFRYALRKVVKQCETLWETWTEAAEDIDIEHAAVGKDDVILRDERGAIAFTKDGLRKRNAARRVLFDSEVKLEPFMAKDVPPLTDVERDAFTGFILPEQTEERELHAV